MRDVLGIIQPIAALLATCLACTLYGAGLRRPFGSVTARYDDPRWLQRARRYVQTADYLFLVFTVAMLLALYRQMSIVTFLALGSIFYTAGEFLAHKVRLVPSFFISLALALLAMVLTFPQSAISLATATAE